MGTLAELIEEYERLEAEPVGDWSHDGRLNHLRRLARMRDEAFPRLLAVAKAAMEMRETLVEWKEHGGKRFDSKCPLCQRIAAFDAAAEGKP